MAGRLTLRTKIVHGLDQARPEQKRPVTINRYPAGQWMVGRHQPAREPKTIRRLITFQRREKGRNVGGYLLSFPLKITAYQHERVARLHFLHDHRVRDALQQVRLAGSRTRQCLLSGPVLRGVRVAIERAE
jgi:hypothetical protein